MLDKLKPLPGRRLVPAPRRGGFHALADLMLPASGIPASGPWRRGITHARPASHRAAALISRYRTG